jgi:uncharacterized NAD-dependent epimerase/dehydratase family protein
MSDTIDPADRPESFYNVRGGYALYTGSVTKAMDCKTATGLVHWRPDLSTCQVKEPGCTVDLGIPVAEHPSDAWSRGARSLVICVTLGGAFLADEWIDRACEYARFGFDIVGTMHRRMVDPRLAAALEAGGGTLVELRHVDMEYPLATGRKRRGLRLLTVGSDGIVGKKFTALSIWKTLVNSGENATFRPTGQTGRLIAGPNMRAIVADSVPADFLTGAVEWLTPDNPDPGHWDVVEGQANLFHPAWGPDTLGLLLGSQPDGLVYCLDATREKQDLTDLPVMPIVQDIVAHLMFARRVNPRCELMGISVNSSGATFCQLAGIHRRIYEALDELDMRDRVFPVFDPNEPSPEFNSLIDAMKRNSALSRSGEREGQRHRQQPSERVSAGAGADPATATVRSDAVLD